MMTMVMSSPEPSKTQTEITVNRVPLDHWNTLVIGTV
jgi:hypothetical protein